MTSHPMWLDDRCSSKPSETDTSPAVSSPLKSSKNKKNRSLWRNRGTAICWMRCGQHAVVEGSQTGGLLIEMLKALWWCSGCGKCKGRVRQRAEQIGIFSFLSFTIQTGGSWCSLTWKGMWTRGDMQVSKASGEHFPWDWTAVVV